MRILIVEDRKIMRSSIKKTITNNYPNVEIVAVESYTELMSKIFALQIDAAIFDIDLSKWEDFLPSENKFIKNEDKIENGFQVYDLVKTLNNVPENVLYIYTANMENLSDQNGTDYNIYKKEFKIGGTAELKAELLDKIINPFLFREDLSLTQLKERNLPQKIHYYKSLVANIPGDKRFENYGLDISYVCYLAKEDNQVKIGKFTNSKHHGKPFEICEYNALEKMAIESDSIPGLLWNFSREAYFERQAQKINKTKFELDIFQLFFRVSYGNNLAHKLLETKKTTSKFETNLNLLKHTGEVCVRELQCNIINQMSENKDSEMSIKNLIHKVGEKTGYKVLDLFHGYLQEFDETNKKAYVKLKSKFDTKRSFLREFDLDRLRNNGIEYKDSAFSYCVSEYKGEVKGYIEPINNL